MAPTQGEMGEVVQGDSLGTAVAKSAGEQLISQVVEQAGGALLKKVPAAGRLKKALGTWGGKPGGLLARGGFQGLGAEFLEERLEEGAQGLYSGAIGEGMEFGPTADILSGDPDRMMQGLKDYAQEGVVIGIIGGPGAVANQARRRQRRQALKPLADQWKDSGSSAYEAVTGKRKPISTPIPIQDVFAIAVQEDSTEAMSELIKHDTPSRRQWAEAGMAPAESDVRTRFVDDMRALQALQQSQTVDSTVPEGFYEGADGELTMDPSKAKPGSVRREFGSDVMVNAAHASDSSENARREMRIVRVEEDTIRPWVDKYYGKG